MCLRLRFLAGDEAATEREFGIGEAEGFASRGGRATGDLEEHGAGLNNGDPAVDPTLTLTHAGFSGFLGDGFVREDADPDFTLTLEATCHRNTGSFNLLGGHTSTGKGLNTEFAKGEAVAFLSGAVNAAFVNLAVFGA